MKKNIMLLLPTPRQPRFHRRVDKLSKNYDITLAFFDRNYNNKNKIPDGNTIISLGKVKEGNYKNRILIYLSAYFKLKRISKSYSILYSFSLDLSLIAILLKRKNHMLWVEIGDIRSFKNKIIQYLYLIFQKYFIFKRIDKLIVTSEGFKKYYIEKFNLESKNIEVIENKIYKKTFNHKRPNTNIINKKITLGIIGFLRYKTILDFLKTYKKSKNNNFEILICGHGPILKQIRDIILDTNIKYLGEFKYPNDLKRLYNKVDYSYVMYDNSDLNVRLALPNKLYESIFFKTPIIVSENTYLKDKVSEYGIGIGFKKNDHHGVIDFLNSFEAHSAHKRYLNKINLIDDRVFIE